MSTEHQKGKRVSRRDFLRLTAGTVAAASLPTIILPKRAEAYQPGARVRPEVDPLRVVGVTDGAMTTEQSVDTPWKVRDPLVNSQAVAANMDRMAAALVEESDPTSAWRRIFIKPPGKSWGDTVVAIKTNQIAQQRTRSAVMSKVCRVLTGPIGVKPSNIYVYDACHGGSMPGNPFKGLPEGVNLANKWGGFAGKAGVPAPYFDGDKTVKCLGPLADDEVDILINLALCKGHGGRFGGFTMSLKNHFGTFEPRPAHRSGGGASYLMAINKTPEILGRMDPKTGNVLFPRQQLCLIDALWASKPGPGGHPTHQPNTLLMGTFNPVLDYVAATSLRRDRMGWGVNEGVLGLLEQQFGFRGDDLPNEGRPIDALKWAG